ncbi:MAG: hypothetical protein ACFBZ8_07200 [Opitutales bacterium]
MIAFASERRSYPITGLGFREFWDLCGHFQRVSPSHDQVTYSLLRGGQPVLENEGNVGEILGFLQHEGNEAADCYKAHLTASPPRGQGSGIFTTAAIAADEPTELTYYRDDDPARNISAGLAISSCALSKLGFFQFEEILQDVFGLEIPIRDAEITFGRPCEVLSCVIDMRGFTLFCEQPNIESPYTCALMGAFYDTVQAGFARYPPEMTKYLGDGVLCVWETTPQDRSVAVETCLRGLVSLSRRYQKVRESPHFSHGTPEEVGAGVSLGLASRLDFGHDYLGRPINMSARYCGVAEGGTLLTDKNLPSIPDDLVRHEHTVHLKSFGRSPVWRFISQ